MSVSYDIEEHGSARARRSGAVLMNPYWYLAAAAARVADSDLDGACRELKVGRRVLDSGMRALEPSLRSALESRFEQMSSAAKCD